MQQGSGKGFNAQKERRSIRGPSSVATDETMAQEREPMMHATPQSRYIGDMQFFFANSPWRSTIIVFFVSFLALLGLMVRDLNVYDEGIIFTGAMRTLNGEIPHRDYYSTYGPGQNYLVAAILNYVSENPIFPRLYSVSVMSAIVVCVYLVQFKRAGIIAITVSLIACLAFLIAFQSHLYPIYPVILLALVGAVFLLWNERSPTLLGSALAGLCAGAAALFRYDGGFFILVSHCVAILLLAQGQSISERINNALQKVFVYGAMSAVFFLPFAAVYLGVANFADFYHDIIHYPLRYYSDMRSLPFPGFKILSTNPEQLAVYFPVFVVAIALVDMARSRPWKNSEALDQKQFPVLVLMLTMTVILYYKGMVRVSTSHMFMSIIPATVLFGILVERAVVKGAGKATVAVFLIVGAIPALGLGRELVMDLVHPDRTFIGWVVGAPEEPGDCSTFQASAAVRLNADYIRTGRYIRAHSRESEKIFVGLNRHDKIFINPMILYHAADRLPGTHWHHFDPGLQTRADIQRQVIADLRRNRVRWVVRDSSFDDVAEPNASARSSGVGILDDFLAEQYRPVASSGKVQIWLAKGAIAPPLGEQRQCMATA
ncbi:hypothetical protein [Blastomonas aquatica]|uniref:hypothetical protein n=1 Tax=Blastomonas aquatica TaxID=1510276 RepID=UPI00166838BE|nr:hypothetical protein [Blastomonas aquatica]